MKEKIALLTSISIFVFSAMIGIRFNAAAVTCLDEANFSKDRQTNPTIASPKTIWVPDNYTKIQWAVDNATAGDIIKVSSGTYSEQVTINKPLTLIGENPSTTIIEGLIVSAYVIKCNASYVNISGFTIQHGIHGIDLNSCSNITISGNTITSNSQFGIFLVSSSNNTIYNNTVSNNGYRGIYLRYSNNNNIIGNTVSHHKERGILLFGSKDNIIDGNTISDTNQIGILCGEAGGASENNIISGNTVLNNTYGIRIRASAGNTLRNNKMNGNRYNFDISAVALGQYIQDIDPSNTVNGKPMYYWVNQANKQVPAGAGYVAVINSKNITVRNQNLTNNAQGILFANTTDSTIVNVNASYNSIGVHIVDEDLLMLPKSGSNVIKDNILARNSRSGIELMYSNNNTFIGNTITENSFGVFSAFCNNTFYHNNFINNLNKTLETQEVSINVWENGYPSGGNYWSKYNGTDSYSGPHQNETGSDGIGDTPYVINEDNQDNYPLMNPIILVDQIITSDDRCDVGTLQTVAFHAVWAHNNSDVIEVDVYVNCTKRVTNSTGWISFDATYYTVGKRVWTITGSISYCIIWDRIKIVDGGVSKTQTNVNQEETVWFKAVYEYDNAAFDGTKGKLYVNSSETTWSTENNRWEYTCSFDTAGTRIFQVTDVSDSQYALTAINDTVGALSITWTELVQLWMQWWFWTAIGAGITVVTAIYLLKVRKR